MTYLDLAWRNGDWVLDPSGDLALEEGTDVIATDLLTRLTSPRGSHWAHPDEGTDLAVYINAATDDLTLLALRQDVELETLRDTRVLDVNATVTTPDLRTGAVTLTVELTSGTLLTLGVTLPTLLGGDST